MATEVQVGAALWAASIAAALTVVLFLYSLALRLAHILHARDIEEMRASLWPILALAATSGELSDRDALRRLKSTPGPKALREWCRFRSLIKSGDGNVMGQLAEVLDLTAIARRELRRRSVGRRIVAMQALGFLRDSYSWDTIEMLLNSKNVSISITAAMALVRISPNRGCRLILGLVCRHREWPRTQIGRILNAAGPDVVSKPLCEAIEAAKAQDAVALLTFYESANVNDIDSLAAKLILGSAEPEVIAAALKAVRGQLPVSVMERLTRHGTWYVRMQAATLLGRFGRREDYRLLEPLLEDPEWWVRYRAAQAIANLPFLGPGALRKLCDRQQDRYARDALVQALAEIGLA